MLKLKEERRIAFLYVTHDLASARYVADDILVMYAGQIVEQGPIEQVLADPLHPYTQLLLSRRAGSGHGRRGEAHRDSQGPRLRRGRPARRLPLRRRAARSRSTCARACTPPLVEARSRPGGALSRQCADACRDLREECLMAGVAPDALHGSRRVRARSRGRARVGRRRSATTVSSSSTCTATTPAQRAEWLDELGLVAVGRHAGLDALENELPALARGARGPRLRPDRAQLDRSAGVERRRARGRRADRRRSRRRAREHGLRFGFHNHWSELAALDDGGHGPRQAARAARSALARARPRLGLGGGRRPRRRARAHERPLPARARQGLSRARHTRGLPGRRRRGRIRARAAGGSRRGRRVARRRAGQSRRLRAFAAVERSFDAVQRILEEAA